MENFGKFSCGWFKDNHKGQMKAYSRKAIWKIALPSIVAYWRNGQGACQASRMDRVSKPAAGTAVTDLD